MTTLETLCHCGHPFGDHTPFTSEAHPGSCMVAGCDCPGWAEADDGRVDDSVADLNEATRAIDARDRR